jgi:N-acylneuraminate cytidylyltransferase
MIALIPARGGSKGLPMKNIKILNGYPLIAWSIKQALSSKSIKKVIVSTDSEEIAEIAEKYGATVPDLRPSEISTDTATTESVIDHYISKWHKRNFGDSIILLQPTSPLRFKNTILKCTNEFLRSNVDSLFSVSLSNSFFWKNIHNPIPLYDFDNRPRRQDINIDEMLYKENGSVYIFKLNGYLIGKNRIYGSKRMQVISEEESFEIDSELDFKIIEKIMEQINFKFI